MAKILAIDDNSDNLISLKAILMDAFPDSVVFTALSGLNGIELATTENPDVILIDVLMPDMDGFEVCSRLKKEEHLSDIPVIFITASKGDGTQRIKALEAGGEGFLSKPIDEQELIAQIRAMFKIKAANEQKRKENEQLARLVAERTKELKDSELYFRTLANSGQLLIWTSGTDKMCDYFNVPWLEFTGRTIEQELGEGWTEGVHPSDLQKCVETYVNAFDKREKFSMEYRVRHNSGEYHWIQDDGTPRYNNDGEFIGYIGHCLDISHLKLAEEELKRKDFLMNKVFDLLPIGLWFADNSGKLIRGNPAGISIWGGEPTVPPDEYGIFKARRLPSGEEIAPDDWALAHTIREGKTIRDELLEIDAFDGQKKIILNYTAPVFDENGQMLGAIVVNNDITKLKQTEYEITKLKDELEIKVEEKTRELKERVADLERFHEATIDRELRMKELRDEIERLKNDKL